MARPHPQSIRRILFYIPVVTPWWFSEVIFPLIRTLSRAHEIHVMVPPLWRGTGIGAAQADLISQTKEVFWHLLDGPNHPQLRTDASDDADLRDFVDSLSPDLTLCRSADVRTTTQFPGVVRHLMEGAAPPFKSGVNRIRLADTLFDYGLMPAFTADETARLDAIGAALWADQIEPLIQTFSSRSQFCATNDLPPDRKIIALPLEYEHPENFFSQHLPYSDNAAMICAIAEHIPDQCVLAVTQHPLNELHSEIGPVQAAIAAMDERVILLDSARTQGRRTLELGYHCDGMITCTSKSWALCAAFEKPLARLTEFRTGHWANTYDNVEHLVAHITAGSARVPNIKKARRWFAYHFANCAFAPLDPDLTADLIVDRSLHPHNPELWGGAIEGYRAQSIEESRDQRGS